MRSVLPEMLKTTGVSALTVVEATVTLKSGEDTDPFSQAAASSEMCIRDSCYTYHWCAFFVRNNA